MRKGKAFILIPELIGDLEYTSELMSNPVQLYIESGIRTLHLATDVINLLVEHENTRKMRENVEKLKEEYDLLSEEKIQYYREERIKQLDNNYQRIKNKIEKKKFNDKEVMTFISLMRQDLVQLMEYLGELQKSDDYCSIDQVGELARRTFRDYNGIINSFIEEKIEIEN